MKLTGNMISKTKEYKLLSHALTNIQDSVYITDEADRVIFVNHGFCQTYGYQKSEIIARKSRVLWSDRHFREDQKQQFELSATEFTKGEFYHKKKDGSEILVCLSCSVFQENAHLLKVFVANDITFQKQRDNALRLSQERYALATSAGNLGVWDWNLQTDELYVDSILKAILGYSDLELPDQVNNWYSVIHPDDKRKVRKAIITHLKGLTVDCEIEYRMLHKNGSVCWFLCRGNAIWDVDNKPYRMSGAITDITNLKITQIALQESEYRYQTLAQISPVGIFRTNAQGYCTYVNDRYCEITGMTPQQVMKEGWKNGLHSEDLERLLDEWKQTLLNQLSFRSEYRFVRPDGSIIWVLGEATAEKNHAGEIIGYVGTLTDINALKQAQEKLQESDRIAKAILNNIPDIAWLKDSESRLIAVNESYSTACGISPDELVGKTDLDIWPSELAEKYILDDREVITTKLRKRVEEPLINVSGNQIWIETIKTPIYNNQGEAIGTLGIARDLTDRKQAEEALRESQERFQTAFENAPIGICLVDIDGRCFQVNRAFCEMLGYSETELLALNFSQITYQEDIERDFELFQQMQPCQIFNWQIEKRYIHKQGQIVWTLLNVSSVYDNDNLLRYFIVQAQDISDRKITEKSLQDRERLLQRQQEGLMVLAKCQSFYTGELLSSVQNITQVAAIALRVERVSVWFFNENRSQIRCVDLYEFTSLEHSCGMEISATDYPAYFEALEEDYLIAADDALTDAQIREFSTSYLALEITSVMNVPIGVAGETVGVICLEHIGSPRRWTLEEQNFASCLASFVSLAIESRDRAQAESDLAESLLLLQKSKDELEIRVQERTAQLAQANLSLQAEVAKRIEAETEVRQLNAQLEQRVIERTAQLEAANRELEAFSYSVSHDLRSPLRSIDGFSQALLEDYYERLDDIGKDYLQRVRLAAQRMGELIDDLLQLSRITRSQMKRENVDLSAIARYIATQLQATKNDNRQVEFIIPDGIVATGDGRLLQVVLENLLGNAWKYTSHHPTARIEFGVFQPSSLSKKEREISPSSQLPIYFVRDDGAGFDMTYAHKLFGVFQRLHSINEFEGTGIGLATVQRIIHRHGGSVWAEGAVEQGATIYFTLENPYPGVTT